MKRIFWRLVSLVVLVGYAQNCPTTCTTTMQNNGTCDVECYVADCNWDNGSCAADECAQGCLISVNKANGTCDQACKNAACEWDGTDCDCAANCSPGLHGNGACDEACNNLQCNYDEGDCLCATGCTPDMLSNNICDAVCAAASACNFDNIDCNSECSTGCLRSQIGDGECQTSCQVPLCNNDDGDCDNACQSAGCIDGFRNDGLCQEVCNISVCDFDYPDCAVMPAPFKTYTLRKLADKEEDIEEDNAGLVVGVGVGVFFIIMFMIIGFFMCIIGLATNIWMVCFIMGIALPLIVFLIVAYAPKHKDVEEEDDDRTDDYVVPRIIFLIVILVSALLSVFKITDFYFGVNLAARRVESKVDDIAAADAMDLQIGADEDEQQDENEVEARPPPEIVDAGPRHFPEQDNAGPPDYYSSNYYTGLTRNMEN